MPHFHFRYRNYPPELLVDIVARILSMVPPWTRVYRVQRDIPMPLVTSGVEKGNLRELALARMEDLGLKCRDVRTREAGIQVQKIDMLSSFTSPAKIITKLHKTKTKESKKILFSKWYLLFNHISKLGHILFFLIN